MTYRGLMNFIQTLKENQKDMKVFIYCEGEYFPLKRTDFSEGSDFIEDHNPVLVIHDIPNEV